MLLIIIGFIFVFLIDFLPLAQQKSKWGMAIFLIFFLVALSFPVLDAFGIEMPSTLVLFEEFLKSIGIAYPQN